MSSNIEVQFSPQSHGDLVRLEAFLWERGDPLAAELFAFLLDSLQVLTHQPAIGRPVGGGVRELIIQRGYHAGYLARYRYSVARQMVWVLRVRRQRESGYLPHEI